MEQDRHVTQHRNPRSQGERDQYHYRKTANDLDLSAEASELRRCKDLALRTEHVRPVDFVDFDPNSNTLTTELIQGRQLFHTLWNPTYWLGRLRGHKEPDWSETADLFEELGQWLRLYHESTTVDGCNRPVHIEWLEETLRRKLEGVRQERALPEPIVDKFETHYLGLLSDIEADPMKHCRVHGDLIIYNLMLDNQNNLRVLDFGDTRVSAGLEDVARFYSGIWAMAQTNRTRKKQLLPLLERFLTGYGLDPKELDSPLFKINLAYNFITHQYSLQSMRPLVSLNSWLELRQISRAGVRWVLQDMKHGGRTL